MQTQEREVNIPAAIDEQDLTDALIAANTDTVELINFDWEDGLGIIAGDRMQEVSERVDALLPGISRSIILMLERQRNHLIRPIAQFTQPQIAKHLTELLDIRYFYMGWQERVKSMFNKSLVACVAFLLCHLRR